VTLTLGEITDRNRRAVLALRAAPGQERFVGSVRSALAAGPCRAWPPPACPYAGWLYVHTPRSRLRWHR